MISQRSCLLILLLLNVMAFADAFSLHLPFGGQPDANSVKEKYEELARYADSSEGACWRNALASMRTQCSQLDEESHARLALHLTHCFLQQHGMGSVPCVEAFIDSGDVRELSVTACLNGAVIGSSDHQASGFEALQMYSQFYIHTRNLCYYYASRLWHERTLTTVGLLTSTTEQITHTLDDNLGVSRELKHDLSSFVDTTQALVAHGRVLNDTISTSVGMFVQYGRAFDEQRQIIVELVHQILNLRSMVIDHITGLKSVVVWLVASVAAYFLTSTERTKGARFWVVLAILVNVVAERLICYALLTRDRAQAESWLSFLTAQPNADIDVVNTTIFWSRVLHGLVAFAILMYFACRFRDFNRENYDILLSLKQENVVIRSILENGGVAHSPPSSDTEAPLPPPASAPLANTRRFNLTPWREHRGLLNSANRQQAADDHVDSALSNTSSDSSGGRTGRDPFLQHVPSFPSISPRPRIARYYSATPSRAVAASVPDQQFNGGAPRQNSSPPLQSTGRNSRVMDVADLPAAADTTTATQPEITADYASMDITNPTVGGGDGRSTSDDDGSSADMEQSSITGSVQIGNRKKRMQKRVRSRSNSVAGNTSVHDMSFTPLKNSAAKTPASFSRQASLARSTTSGSVVNRPSAPATPTKQSGSTSSPYSLRLTPSRRQQQQQNSAGNASPLGNAASSIWRNVISPAVSALVPERIVEEDESAAGGSGGNAYAVLSDNEPDTDAGDSRTNRNGLKSAADGASAVAGGDGGVDINNEVQRLAGITARNRAKADATVRHGQLLGVFSSDEEDGMDRSAENRQSA